MHIIILSCYYDLALLQFLHFRDQLLVYFQLKKLWTVYFTEMGRANPKSTGKMFGKDNFAEKDASFTSAILHKAMVINSFSTKRWP